MWKVKGALVDLPVGFEIQEDTNFVYLYFGEEEVAVFSRAGVKPEKIEEAAKNHLIQTKKRE